MSALAAPALPLERVGTRVLQLGLAAGLALAGVAAVQLPDLAPLLPLPLLVVGVGLVLLRFPTAYLTSVLMLGAALSVRTEGVQPAEIAYVGWTTLFLVQWYARRWHTGEPFIQSRADIAAALYMVLGVGFGAVLGLVNGADVADFRAEVVACLSFFLYFPIKEAVRTERKGVEAVVVALLWLGLFAAVRNGYLMQQALSSADALYQIADVRYNYGETFLSAAFLVGLAVLASLRGRVGQVLLLGALSLLLAGLILTKSRGFWVSTVLGLLACMAVMQGRQRGRIVAFSLFGALTFVALASIFLSDYIGLLVNGLVRRFGTLSSATTQDVSLVNRFVETHAAMERIKQNPLLGYGWGVPISYYSLVFIGTVHVAFIHNGYVSLWFKVGLWGLGLMLFVWASALLQAWRAGRSAHLPPVHRAAAAGAGGALVAFTVATLTSNPFTIPDQLLAVTILLALLHGLAQRADAAAGAAAGGAPTPAAPAAG